MDFAGSKSAVTVRLMSIGTVQVGVSPGQLNPASELLQPLKAEPPGAVSVNVTLAAVKLFGPQVEPQVIPAGLLVTEPDPVPGPFVTVRVCVVLTNVAVTFFA